MAPVTLLTSKYVSKHNNPLYDAVLYYVYCILSAQNAYPAFVLLKINKCLHMYKTDIYPVLSSY